MSSGIITTAFVQKIKESFKFKKSSRLVIVSFLVSMILGFLFALSFSDIDISIFFENDKYECIQKYEELFYYMLMQVFNIL